MKAKSGFVFFFGILLTIVLPTRGYSLDRWGEDRLIGHFDEGISSLGPGYSNFHCLYGSSADVFVVFVENITAPSGDKLTIRKSTNNGLTWTLQKSVLGGVNNLVSPGVVAIPGTDMVIMSVITQFPNGQHIIDTYRYNYSTLAWGGYSQADFSYPGAGNPEVCIPVSNEVSQEVWLFAVDDNNWLYLTRTSDGVTWTPSVPVAVNVARPSAEASLDGKIAVTWSNTNTGDIYCAVASADGTFQPAVLVTQSAATNASPIAGWEQVGDENLGIVWHSVGGSCFLNISSDEGQTWSIGQIFGEGLYPYIDRFPGTRRMGACYTTASGDINVASAATISSLPIAEFQTRNGYQAYTQGPARTAFGESSGQLALFYLTPGLDDFWFNSSLITGIEGETGSVAAEVTAGPNPGSGMLSISATGFQSPPDIRVYSVDGRLHYQRESSTGEEVIDAGAFPAGTYVVIAEGDGLLATCRIVRF